MRDQQRAADAAKLVQSVVHDFKGKRGEVLKFRAMALALPVTIRTNGLLQAVAFFESKAGPDNGQDGAERRLLNTLQAQMVAGGYPRPSRLWSESLCGLQMAEFLRWQEEAVACAAWIKRFAAALIEKPATGEDRP